MSLDRVSRRGLLGSTVSALLSQAVSGGQSPRTAAFHYQPEGGVFGDAMPLFHNGAHHVFYLHRALNAEGSLTSPYEWRHIVSRDLVYWREQPPAIVPGDGDETIVTGSIVERDGAYQAFYMSRRSGARRGEHYVCRASSRDLVHWAKDPANPLLTVKRNGPAVGPYDLGLHWRDPHVFWNPAAREWWMAIAAHEQSGGAYPYGSAIALAASPDLNHWTVRPEPLLRDRDSISCECPDVFRSGGRWVLMWLSSEQHFRVADSPAGPWKRPVNDRPTGLGLLAAKTVFDGRRRILHAFLPRYSDDYSDTLWGGVMALPRELHLDENGRLTVRMPPEIESACCRDATSGKGGLLFTPLLDSPVLTARNSVVLNASAGEAAVALWKNAPADLFLTASVSIASGGVLTFLLRGSPQAKPQGRLQSSDIDDCYALRLDSGEKVATLHRRYDWSRQPPLRARSFDFPASRPFRVQIMLHRDVMEVFVGDTFSMSARLWLPSGGLGLLARDAPVSLSNLRIAHLPRTEQP